MKIVTGHTGEPHITSNDVLSANQGVVGADYYVLDVGEKGRAELISNNEVRIYDGEFMMQGVHFRIEPGKYETVTIENGTQGMKRIDLIVASYTRTSSTGVENVELRVIKGASVVENPRKPATAIGYIRSGTRYADMILYAVELDGLNVVSITSEFGEPVSLAKLNAMLKEQSSSVGSNYIKFENGTLIQWGRANTEAERQGDILIALPVPFADANYSVNISPTRNGSILEGIWVADESANPAKTQKNFRVGYLVKSGQSYYNVGVDWVAIGRWK
ncbi:MAG TPA: hypothetical protein DEB74_12440 [Lachnospiraceae bacterium]|nr:hypothetical protein [Lachnospiraceae bacterium]